MRTRRRPPAEPAAAASRAGSAGGAGLIDIHCHLVPGVDDGAADEDEARAALAAFRGDGVAGLVVTPHFEAGLQLRPEEFAARLDEIDRGWARLQPLLAEVGLAGYRGVELRLDLARPDVGDPRLRLAGGPFVLCEFAWFTIPPRSEVVLAGIRRDGWYPVIAHPERYSGIGNDPGLIDRWLEAGAFLQVNGGSLLGRYGEKARAAAADLLAAGKVQYVASDYHAKRTPRIREYRDVLVTLVGEAGAAALTSDNPARLLRGEPPVRVGPDSAGPAAGAAGSRDPGVPEAGSAAEGP